MFDTIHIASEFEGAAHIGILLMDGVRVQESSEELRAMLNGLADDYAGKYKDQPLGDIATVKRGYEDPPGFLVREGGRPALGLGVSMQEGSNILALGEDLKRAMDAIEAELPVGIEVTQIANQPKLERPPAVDGNEVALAEIAALSPLIDAVNDSGAIPADRLTGQADEVLGRIESNRAALVPFFAGKTFQGVRIEGLKALELHSIIRLRSADQVDPVLNRAVPDRCSFAVDEVLVAHAEGHARLTIEQFRETFEHCRVGLDLLFPPRQVDRGVLQGRYTLLAFLSGEIA